jgi:hypothetical protein
MTPTTVGLQRAVLRIQAIADVAPFGHPASIEHSRAARSAAVNPPPCAYLIPQA